MELIEFVFVLRGQAKGIETDISSEVFFLEDTARSEDITRGGPSLDGTVEFEGTNDEGQDLEESRGDGTNLVKVTDGRSDILVVGLEERVELDGFLGDEETDGSEHGNTSVLKLGLTVLLHGFEVLALGESERIEVSNGIKSTRESVGELVGIRDEGGGHSESRDGSGGGEKGGGGEGEVHGCVCLKFFLLV